MKSLREYIEIVNEAGGVVPYKSGAVVPGRAPAPQSQIKDIGGHSTSSNVPATTTPSNAGSGVQTALNAASALPGTLGKAAAALGTGYAAGTALNQIPAVNAVTDKIGQGVANAWDWATGNDQAPEVNKSKASGPMTQAEFEKYRIPKTQQPGAKTPPTGQGAKPTAGQGAKPAFKDLGAQYGYNSPEEVQQIQQQLASMGYPVAVDGKFGPKTQAAYQQAYSQMYGQQPGQTDPNAPVPQNYQQGQATKQDLSKDMAAAVGVPNPYATAPAAAPSQQKQDLLAKAAEFTKAGDAAKAKIYTDAAARMNESIEIDRIKSLINYK